MIQRLHHATLEIPVGGEHIARSFYQQILGLQEITIPLALRDHEGGSVWFQLAENGQQLHLGPQHGFTPQRRGHIALEVADFAALQASLEAHRIEIQQVVQEPGWTRAKVRDPFGNIIELRQLLPV